MCSLKWPELLGSDSVDVMLDVVTVVAERSFFSVAEPCDDHRFATLSGNTTRWIVAAVRFAEADCTGVVSCTLAEDLAHMLFDAFTGRDPVEPEPEPEHLYDLVGEFTNMICGLWLTRLASQQTFSLSRPTVQQVPDRSLLALADARLLLVINEMPLAVEVRLVPTAEQALTGAEV